MAHIFKPGDRAYFPAKNKWVTLRNASTSRLPNLLEIEEDGIYVDPTYMLSPINISDPCDPNNPPEFRYPFMLNGRPVKVGDEVIYKRNGEPVDGQVYVLGISEGRPWAVIHYNSCSSATLGFDSGHLCWPDEPPKKKVAKWAYPVIGMPGVIRIEFTDEMTKEEARKGYGTSVQMIPGTEREIEG